jgi:hypothetical protein
MQQQVSALTSVCLHDSDSVYLLVLPGIAANLGCSAEATCGASLLLKMVGVATTSTASDVSLGSTTWPKRGRALSHSRSRASAKQYGYLCQPRSLNFACLQRLGGGLTSTTLSPLTMIVPILFALSGFVISSASSRTRFMC